MDIVVVYPSFTIKLFLMCGFHITVLVVVVELTTKYAKVKFQLGKKIKDELSLQKTLCIIRILSRSSKTSNMLAERNIF